MCYVCKKHIYLLKYLQCGPELVTRQRKFRGDSFDGILELYGT